MKNKTEEFYSLFYEKYPNHKIIEFKNYTSPIIIMTPDGVLHKKESARRVLSHNLRFDSIIDKIGYLQNKLKFLFPNLTLIEFNGIKGNVIVQDDNGFRYMPQCYDLLKGHPVSIQTCTEKEKLFIFKANIKHNNLYEYPNFVFINGKQHIDIICKTHGLFNQSIESHLFGRGCSKCGKIGFSKQSWLNRLKNKKAIFYILKVFNENEEFIKIGITSNSVKVRYKSLKNYNYTILKEITNYPLFIYDLEKSLLKKYRQHKVHPNLKFQGKNECIDIKQLNNIINECK